MNKFPSRLLKLADLLDKLPPEKFNYHRVIVGDDIPRDTFDCGSTACAIGWAPIAMPDELRYERNAAGSVCIFERKNASNLSAGGHYDSVVVADFFCVSTQEANGLFIPCYQGGIDEPHLSNEASAKDVAALIRRFVAKKQAAQTA